MKGDVVDAVNKWDRSEHTGSVKKDVKATSRLAEFMGVEKFSRQDAMQRIWRHAEKKELFDDQDHRYIKCDVELKRVFGTTRDRIHMFACATELDCHMKSSNSSRQLPGKTSCHY